MRRSELHLAALAIGSAVSLLPFEASAFCLTSSCGEDPGQLCTPPSPADCGVAVAWRRACIGWSVQEDASGQVDLATAEALMTQAFFTWTEAMCPAGGTPSIAAQNIGTVECDQQEYNQEDGNANAVIFRDAVWPYEGQGHTLALTTVTYNLDTGEIFDADLEINATPEVTLTTGDQDIQHDLPSILTHEVGHMLGIAHSPVTGATMTLQYVPGDDSLRSLHPDDVEAICTAYPPDADPGACDPTPRHGFQEECGQDQETDDGCGCRLAPAETRPGLFALAGALAWFLRRRRR